MRFRSPPKERGLVNYKGEWQESLKSIRNTDVIYDIKGILEIIKCILVIPIVYILAALLFPVNIVRGYHTCYRYCFYKLTEKEEEGVQRFLKKYGGNK